MKWLRHKSCWRAWHPPSNGRRQMAHALPNALCMAITTCSRIAWHAGRLIKWSKMDHGWGPMMMRPNDDAYSMLMFFLFVTLQSQYVWVVTCQCYLVFLLHSCVLLLPNNGTSNAVSCLIKPFSCVWLHMCVDGANDLDIQMHMQHAQAQQHSSTCTHAWCVYAHAQAQRHHWHHCSNTLAL